MQRPRDRIDSTRPDRQSRRMTDDEVVLLCFFVARIINGLQRKSVFTRTKFFTVDCPFTASGAWARRASPRFAGKLEPVKSQYKRFDTRTRCRCYTVDRF